MVFPPLAFSVDPDVRNPLTIFSMVGRSIPSWSSPLSPFPRRYVLRCGKVTAYARFEASFVNVLDVSFTTRRFAACSIATYAVLT